MATDQQKAYAFKITGRKKRLSCQSGGAFTAIAGELMAQGWVIYGVVYEKPYAVYKRAEDMSCLNRMAGSKYVQAKIGDAFQLIAADLTNGINVLFSGTPCYVSAILNFCRVKKIDSRNLLTMEFLCHGVPSPELFRYYLEYTERQEKFLSTHFVFRDKSAVGWGGYYSAFNLGKVRKATLSWLDIFNSDSYLRESCYHCRYTSYERNADLTVSDFWGIGLVNKSFGDLIGVSMILVNTTKGLNCTESCHLPGDLLSVPVSTIDQSPLNHPVKYQDDRVPIDWGNKTFEENAELIMKHYYKKSINLFRGVPLTFNMKFWKEYLMFLVKGNILLIKCKERITKNGRK